MKERNEGKKENPGKANTCKEINKKQINVKNEKENV